MNDLFWAVVIGFSVVAVLLYAVIDEIGKLRKDIDRTLGELGPIHYELKQMRKSTEADR